MFCSRRAAGVPQKLAGDVAYNGPFGDSTVLPSSQHGAKVGLTEREAPFGGSPMAPRKLVLTPTGFVNSPSSLLATRALGDVVTRAEQDGGEVHPCRAVLLAHLLPEAAREQRAAVV